MVARHFPAGEWLMVAVGTFLGNLHVAVEDAAAVSKEAADLDAERMRHANVAPAELLVGVRPRLQWFGRNLQRRNVVAAGGMSRMEPFTSCSF